MQQPVIKDQKVSGNEVWLNLFIQPDLICFEGHFPKTPILPGVVMLNWAESLGRQFAGAIGEFESIQNLKFQQVIKPAMDIELTLRLDAEKNLLHFSYTSLEARHASGKIRFKL